MPFPSPYIYILMQISPGHSFLYSLLEEGQHTIAQPRRHAARCTRTVHSLAEVGRAGGKGKGKKKKKEHTARRHLGNRSAHILCAMAKKLPLCDTPLRRHGRWGLYALGFCARFGLSKGASFRRAVFDASSRKRSMWRPGQAVSPALHRYSIMPTAANGFVCIDLRTIRGLGALGHSQLLFRRIASADGRRVQAWGMLGTIVVIITIIILVVTAGNSLVLTAWPASF